MKKITEREAIRETEQEEDDNEAMIRFEKNLSMSMVNESQKELVINLLEDLVPIPARNESVDFGASKFYPRDRQSINVSESIDMQSVMESNKNSTVNNSYSHILRGERQLNCPSNKNNSMPMAELIQAISIKKSEEIAKQLTSGTDRTFNLSTSVDAALSKNRRV